MAQGYRFSLLLLLLVWPGLGAGTLAQAVPPQAVAIVHITLGNSTAPLYGPWKFQVGDSPVDPVTHSPLWAEPGFDDSNWETVDLTPPRTSVDPVYGASEMVPGWTARGHAGHSGYGWYRIRVQVEAPAGEKLALEGPPGVDDIYKLFRNPPVVDDVYQAFQNGNLLGSFGDFSGGRPVAYFTQPMMFTLPQAGGRGSTTEVLAFRVWMEPFTLTLDPNVGGLRTAPLLGEVGAVAANYKLRWLKNVLTHADYLVLAPVFVLLALGAFSLTLFDHSDRVYLWLGAAFLTTGVYFALTIFIATTQHIGFEALEVFKIVVLGSLIQPEWVMVWWSWFRLDRPSWLPKAVALLALLYVVSTALSRNVLYFTVIPHPVSTAFGIVYLFSKLLFLPLTLVCIVQGIRRDGLEGWSVLPAVVLYTIALFWNELNFLHIHLTWFPFGTVITITDIAYLLLVVVIAGLLLRRLLLTGRRQRLLEMDVKQAQEVQRVILPEPIATLPGLVIESEYRPAREVGGDFFQIIPHPYNGSMLIVAGDVAGKGLQAGMLVALLVGAIRTSAQFDPDPLSVLKVLNERLWGRSHAAATCLALRIAADGGGMLANAGHLPPYLNGQPVEIEGSLPLGMIEDAEFSVLQFRFTQGDQLLLMSDGITEATDLNGNLFGFERVLDLVRNSASAAAIATAAQNFGQEDDISVIAITRTAA